MGKMEGEMEGGVKECMSGHEGGCIYVCGCVGGIGWGACLSEATVLLK